MKNALLLARRNIIIYWRDRTGVFLSFLAAGILLLLYVVFLHKINVDGILLTMLLEAADPKIVPRADADYFINSWVYSSIVSVTTVTTGLGALVGFVDDRISGRFNEFVVMPIRRWQIVAGYYIASVAVAFVMTTIILFGGWGLLWIISGAGPEPAGVLQAWGWVLLLSSAFSAMSCFLITFVRTTGAFTSLSTIVGTMIGFVTASYIPGTMLPEKVLDALNLLPFAQATSLIRRSLTSPALDHLSQGSGYWYQRISDHYGFSLVVNGQVLPEWVPVVSLGAMIIVFGALAIVTLHRRIKSNR
jgi:multidrug/hemolysin transport system permease protein